MKSDVEGCSQEEWSHKRYGRHTYCPSKPQDVKTWHQGRRGTLARGIPGGPNTHASLDFRPSLLAHSAHFYHLAPRTPEQLRAAPCGAL